MDIKTNYGTLKDCRINTDYFENGQVAKAFTHETSTLMTPLGSFDLAHDFSSPRRKYIPSVKFFPDGSVQAINLDTPKVLNTSCGDFPVEYVTFYPNGMLCRAFHLNGKVSGYWSEQQEVDLASVLSLTTPVGVITAKIMSLHFFENGALASITFFPGQLIAITTPLGIIETKVGLSFSENGRLHSIEPAEPVQIETPVGLINAFEPYPLGVTADQNSLGWDDLGQLNSCKTMDSLQIKCSDDSIFLIEPNIQLSLYDDDVKEKVPYIINWDDTTISFYGTEQGDISLPLSSVSK